MIQHASQTDTSITSDIPGFICVKDHPQGPYARHMFKPSKAESPQQWLDEQIATDNAKDNSGPVIILWQIDPNATITAEQAFEQFKRLMAQNQ